MLVVVSLSGNASTHLVKRSVITSKYLLTFVDVGIGPTTVWRKILTRENIDEFDEFPAIRQYFPYQNFLFS